MRMRSELSKTLINESKIIHRGKIKENNQQYFLKGILVGVFSFHKMIVG